MTAGSCGESLLSFVKTCQAVFQRGCTILRSHQQSMRVPAAPHLGLCLALVEFWMWAILTAVEVTLHCCFNLQFSGGTWCGMSFLSSLWTWAGRRNNTYLSLFLAAPPCLDEGFLSSAVKTLQIIKHVSAPRRRKHVFTKSQSSFRSYSYALR